VSRRKELNCIKISFIRMLEKIWRKGNSYTMCGSVNCYSHYGKQYESSLKKIELLYDPAGKDVSYNSKRNIHPNVHNCTI